MKITIVGAGTVGFNLASTLSAEGHEISVVEVRSEQLDRLRDRLDVSVVEGSGTSASVLREAGAPDADIFIAVTENDEVNMVACTLQHALAGRGRRFARVRNPDFAGSEPVVPKRAFQISRIIDPDEATISELIDAILDPGVTDSAAFGEGEILLRGTVLEEDSSFVGVPLAKLRERESEVPFLIAAIDRAGALTIPTGDTLLEPKDHIFLILRRSALDAFRSLIHAERGVRDVVIYGAGRVGLRLAQELERRIPRARIVLIEEDAEVAGRAAEQLDRALVLCGSITDPAILNDAQVRDADYFVATSHRDEMNLVAATFAQRLEHGPRVGVVTANPDFVPAFSILDLDLVVNERLITAEAILRFVRVGRYIAVKRLNEQGAEVGEILVQKGARADGRKLRDLALPNGALVVAIHRAGEAILPNGETEIRNGDKVVLVTQPAVREKAGRMFFHKKWMSLQEQHLRR